MAVGPLLETIPTCMLRLRKHVIALVVLGCRIRLTIIRVIGAIGLSLALVLGALLLCVMSSIWVLSVVLFLVCVRIVGLDMSTLGVLSNYALRTLKSVDDYPCVSEKGIAVAVS